MTKAEIAESLRDHTYIHMCTSRRKPGTYFSSLVPCDAYAALKQLSMTLDILEGHAELSTDADTDEELLVYSASLIRAMVV